MGAPKALVVNCSEKHYNLGAAKLADYLAGEGYDVETAAGDPGLYAYGFDLVCLSVVFSWHAPVAREIALRVKTSAEVWCGGPGMTALEKWWTRETGLHCTVGLDQRFERQRGAYKMVFASRGCPVGCWFCIVPKIEGTTFTLDWDFKPASVLCDNNLSALPVEFQEHIIARYVATGVPLLDANSGFEPQAFDEETYRRWKPVLRGAWRFAFDESRELEDVRRMLAILAGESARRKRVYVLVGNEPVEACHERAQKVIEWGGEPYCQFVRPLNHLGGLIPTRYDWTEQKGKDFCRYYNRFVWRSVPIWEYNNRQNDAPPFADLRPSLAA